MYLEVSANVNTTVAHRKPQYVVAQSHFKSAATSKSSGFERVKLGPVLY